jgi:calcineurin-like phosphoesterase family protein
MNECMVNEWNSKVADDDLVYILGDIAFCSVTETIEILQTLKGNKILIEGNHDRNHLEVSKFREQFVSIHQYHEVKQDGNTICMFHYPISEWNKCHYGSIMLHGHLHGATSGLEQYRIRDVGMDATGNVVTLLSDVVIEALTGNIRRHGG